MNRKQFLQSLIGTSAYIASSLSAHPRYEPDEVQMAMDSVVRKVKGSAFGLKSEPITSVTGELNQSNLMNNKRI